MQITIVVDDKTVICDGFGVELPGVDWTRFDGDPASKWDDVQAVQFNTDDKQGHVEYRTVVTVPPVRPNFRPGDWHITAEDFEREFAWILPLYVAERERLMAEQTRAEAAAEHQRLAAAEQAETARREAIRRASDPGTTPAPPMEDMDELKAKLAALEATVAAQQKAFADLDKILPENGE